MSGFAFSSAEGEPRCGLCQRAEPLFAKAVAYGSYEGGLRELIHLLKYDKVRSVANVLGRMLAETISHLDTIFGDSRVVVIPVPLHRKKFRQREFNQSELITRVALKMLNSTTGFELAPSVLERRRETQSQIGLSRHQRRENIRGAFGVADAEAIKERTVLLIDDVFTTGTTVSECARVLRRAGASKVYVATVARTLKFEAQRVVLQEPAADETMALAAHGS